MKANKTLSEMSDEELENIANGRSQEKNVSDLSNEQLYKIANQAESKGFSGIASDAFNKAIQTAISLPGALASLPGEAYGAGKQLLTDPKRALQNIGGGFGELGHGILSAPGNVRDYLAKKDIISQKAPSLRLPESMLPRDYNYAETLGAEGHQKGDELLRGLPTGIALAPLAEAIPGVLAKVPGITNKSIANQLSRHKASAIENAKTDYNSLFNDVKGMGVERISTPKINSSDIIRNSQPKYHEALKKYISDHTFENAHWAQSDLGFIIRHLQKVDEKTGLSSTQHKTLKNALTAQNRIKKAMFEDKMLKKNPGLENKYNQLSGEYAQNVVPYRQLEELSDYENKRLKPNNLIKQLLNNDEFMLGIGKKYTPQLLANKALRSHISKIIGGGVLGGLGFEEGRKFIK